MPALNHLLDLQWIRCQQIYELGWALRLPQEAALSVRDGASLELGIRLSFQRHRDFLRE